MALINDPNITAQLQDLAGGGQIDSNDVIALLNSALPAGQQLQSGAGVTTGIYKRFGEFDKVTVPQVANPMALDLQQLQRHSFSKLEASCSNEYHRLEEVSTRVHEY